MRFISYTQNFEDVMLWRALKGIERGFYIDVGANDPEEHSVTKAFYDRGWRGINIEPVEAFYERLRLARREDVNLRLAAAAAPGPVRFFDIAETGLSTTEPKIAERHCAIGHHVTEIEVEADTLAHICAAHVRGDVHFLKIDVEGGTRSVVEGLDLDRVRPWIILVEATEPMSQVPDYTGWEPLITGHDYSFVYYDGLNRFYVANERPAIAAAFDCPPNVFDDFSVIATEAAQQRACQTEQALAEQVARVRAAEERAYVNERRVAELELQAAAATVQLRVLEDELRAVFASRSWRVTKPLRILSDALRGRHPAPIAARRTELRRPRPTVFIECTHTYHSDLNTGIQRVVRNVLRNAPMVAQEYGYDVVPVIVEGEQLRFADANRVLANKLRTPPVAPPLPSLRQRVWRRLLRAISAALPFRHRGYAAAPAGAPRCLDDYNRCDGSILLLLDSSWTTPIWPGTRRFKERGGMVVGVVYDLIPITHSHTSVPELTTAFKAWIAEHLRVTDGFVCISRSIADMLGEYIRALGPAAPCVCPQIDYFHLGSELDFIDLDHPVRPAIHDIFAAERHVFLMVGTIEPRKMHDYVLDAFDRFWAEGGDAALVIVGRRTWKMEAFLERAATHPQHGCRLFVLRDATDAELDHCYRNASSLVIASEIEGFGLPVVEAFQRGLPVMCSDISVFREIADGKATFFSLSESANLTAALVAFCQRVPLDERRKRVPQSWISWRESTQQIFTAIMRTQQRPRVPARGG